VIPDARKPSASIAAMPRTLLLIVSAALGVASALAVASCGGDGEIENKLSRGDARSLLSEIQQVRQSFNGGDCTSAEVDADGLVAEVEGLPRSVDEDLRRALRNGARQLALLVQQECEEPTEPTTTEEEEPTEPTTTEEEPTEEETTAPTTTEETTTEEPTTTEPPPGGGGVGPPGGGVSP
jgi:hypothetical protein